MSQTSTPLTPDCIKLLTNAARAFHRNPAAFKKAGLRLDSQYNESACRKRAESKRDDDLVGLPPDVPMRAAIDKPIEDGQLTPLARAMQAIEETAEIARGDFIRDMTQDQAEDIVLLTIIADDSKAHETLPICEFQRLPWAWNANVDGRPYQGRHLLRPSVQQPTWLNLVSVALDRLTYDSWRALIEFADAGIRQKTGNEKSNPWRGDGATPKPTPSERKQLKIQKIAAAMCCVFANPEWSDREIAKHAVMKPWTLSRCEQYQAAAKIARERRRIPAGFVSIDPTTKGRQLEAYARSDGEASEDTEPPARRLPPHKTPKCNSDCNGKARRRH